MSTYSYHPDDAAACLALHRQLTRTKLVACRYLYADGKPCGRLAQYGTERCLNHTEVIW